MKRKAALLAACFLASTPIGAGQFGTGFAVSPKGYLITCNHVVKEADRVLVHVGGYFHEAAVVALDPANDLAILKIPSWSGPHLALTPSSEVTYASPIIAAGFPDPTVLGINPKISTGVVNALTGVRDDPRYVQISAPVQPGNSGGPLISETGRVVAVVAAGLNSMDRMTHGGYLPQTVNYAIKSDLIYPLLKNASISLPKFGTRTSPGQKQIDRTLGAIVLIEGLKRGERMFVASQPAPQPKRSRWRRSEAPELASLSTSGRPSGPWVFPDSHTRPLGISEVSQTSPEALWRARNEIYLRHGFVFPTEEGRRFAASYGSEYRPATPSIEAIQSQLTPVEVANLRLIADFEKPRR